MVHKCGNIRWNAIYLVVVRIDVWMQGRCLHFVRLLSMTASQGQLVYTLPGLGNVNWGTLLGFRTKPLTRRFCVQSFSLIFAAAQIKRVNVLRENRQIRRPNNRPLASWPFVWKPLQRVKRNFIWTGYRSVLPYCYVDFIIQSML